MVVAVVVVLVLLVLFTSALLEMQDQWSHRDDPLPWEDDARP